MAAPQLSDLLAKGRAAFVMVEIQPNVIGPDAPWPPLSEAAAKVNLVGNAARIATAGRAAGAPIFHCTADVLPGTLGRSTNGRLFNQGRSKTGGQPLVDPSMNRPFPETWQDGDILMPRYNGLSSIHGTALDQVLRNEGITTIVLSGVSLAFGVLSTAIGAVNCGYQVIIPRDAAAGFPEAYAQAVLDNTLMMITTLSTTDDVVAAWQAAAA